MELKAYSTSRFSELISPGTESVELAKDLLLNLYHTKSIWYRVSGNVESAVEFAEKMLEEAEKSGYRLKAAEAALLIAELKYEQREHRTNIIVSAKRAIELALCDDGKFRYMIVFDKASNLLKLCEAYS